MMGIYIVVSSIVFKSLLYSFHPYLFFNNDQDTFTFMGFYVNEKCDAVDPNTQRIIIQSVLQNDLRLLLKQSSVDLSDNYLKW